MQDDNTQIVGAGATVTYREVVGGVFASTGKVRTVKNLGWLFKHASQVTELHFKHVAGMDYTLTAYLMDGVIFRCAYASREVFATVFNRNRTLRGIVVYFDNDETQAVGELTGKPIEYGKVLSVDALHDGNGWSWNSWHNVGEYPLTLLDESPRKIIKWFRDNGFLADASRGRVAIEDDQYNLVVVDRSNGQPLFALEYGNKF